MKNDMLTKVYKLLGADPYHGPMATSNGEGLGCKQDRMGSWTVEAINESHQSAKSGFDSLSSPPNDQHFPSYIRSQAE